MNLKSKYLVGITAIFFSLIIIGNAYSLTFLTTYNPWTSTLDYYVVYNSSDDINVSTINLTHIIFHSFGACTIKTYANGTAYCGEDIIGGGGTAIWQVVGGWMSGNTTAGGTDKINVTDINTTRLNVSGTATIGMADIMGNADIGGDADISGNAGVTGNVSAAKFRRNETINSTFYIDDDGSFVFYAEIV